MASILESIKKGRIRNVCPKIVISNRADAPGLKKAEGLRSTYYGCDDKIQKDWEFDKNIIKILYEYGVTPEEGLLCLAGYMKILSTPVCKGIWNENIKYTPFSLTVIPRTSPSEAGKTRRIVEEFRADNADIGDCLPLLVGLEIDAG